MKKLYIKAKRSLGMFDLVKGLLMIMIILEHSYEAFYLLEIPHSVIGIPLALIAIPLVYGVIPLFFMICGYSSRKMPISQCVSSCVRFLLKPYCILAAVIIVINVVKTIVLHKPILSRLIALGSTYGLATCPGGISIFGIETTSIGPVWFLVAFFFSSILLNCILMIKDIRLQSLTVILMGIAGILLKDRALPFCIQQSFICTGYMYLGWFIKKRKLLNKGIPIALYFGMLLLTLVLGSQNIIDVATNQWNNGVLGLICSYIAGLLIGYLALNINITNKKANASISWIGRNAMYICCIHTVLYKVLPWGGLVRFLPVPRMICMVIVALIHSVFAFGGCELILRLIKMRKHA